MSLNYEKYINAAKRKIADFGMDVTFLIPAVAGGVYDPISGELTEENKEMAVAAVMLDIEAKDIGTGLVEAGDARLLVSGDNLGNAPDSGATVKIKDELWRVIQTTCIAPAGVPLLWKLLIRRS